MSSCRKASELISLSMDRPLALRERLALGVHLLQCRMCRRYRRQVRFVRRATRQMAERLGTIAPPGLDLPQESAARIAQALARMRKRPDR